MKVVQKEGTKGVYLEVKRLYLPGIVLSGACPGCGIVHKHDFGEWYLSYPTAGEPFTHTCYCSHCDLEWEIQLQLDIGLKVVEN
jgi:hypothetical protein